MTTEEIIWELSLLFDGRNGEGHRELYRATVQALRDFDELRKRAREIRDVTRSERDAVCLIRDLAAEKVEP